MEIAAVVLFGVTILFALGMARLRAGGRKYQPVGLVVPHGLFALAGIVVYVLLLVGADDPSQLALVALGLFVAAALGGITLFFMELRGRAPKLPLIAGHAGAALAAFVLLLVGLFGNGY